MAEHGKKTGWSKQKIMVAIIVAVCMAAALAVGIWLALSDVEGRPTGAAGEPASSAAQAQTLADYPRTAPIDNMKAVRMTPGVDYYTDAKNTVADVRGQIDTALAACEKWQFNAVLADMTLQGRPLDTLALIDGNQPFDPLTYLMEQAHGKDLTVYLVLDLQIGQEDGFDPSVSASLVSLQQAVDEAVTAYPADGYFLTGYSYPAEAVVQMNDEPLLRQAVDQAVSYAVTTILKQNGCTVGLLANPVWADVDASPDGIKVSGTYQDDTDGYADTRHWIQEGWFDSVMVLNQTALEDKQLPFATVLDWWDGLCTAENLPLYVAHTADGWDSPDQLPRQVVACRSAKAWEGSVFGSAAVLQKNTDKATDVLLQVLKATAQEEYLEDKLTVTSPAETDTTTLESRFTLQGSADPNFPLTINGKTVEVSDHGFFAKDVTLSVGKNTFALRHKGQTLTYTVTYTVQVLKSVAPVRDLKLEGGTALTISAIARKGSTVSAKIGATTISLHSAPLQMENGSEDLSDYENFSGTYVMPAGITGKTQNLGAVVVKGQYQGLSESMKGGRLYVAALKPTVSEPPSSGGGSNGNDTNILDPSKGSTVLARGTLVTVTAEYAETFRGDTVEDYSRPTNAYLAKGTTDVLVRQVFDSASEHYYYQLGSGRRVYMDDATIYKNAGTLTANTLTGGQTAFDSDATTITFGSQWKIPYNVQLLPQQYRNINTTSQPSYDVSATGQTTEYVDVTFYYTDTVPAAPNVSGSPLFSKAAWIKGQDHQVILRLTLTRKAQFYGYSIRWESGGKMVLSFKHAPAVSSGSQPLKGIQIVLDAGHGGSSIGTAAGSLPEKTLTLQYAQTLQKKLQALGATVKMTRTTDTCPPDDARTGAARNNGTDLLISIHMDGSTSSATSGCSIHYFNEYSYLPAKTIVAKMREVERTFGIGSRQDVCLWNPFFITRVSDAPSMLIECGFMSNPHNLEQLISSGYRDLLTQAITDGVVAYFRSLPVMNAGASTTTAAGSTTTTITARTTMTSPPTMAATVEAALPPDDRRTGNP